MADNDIRMKVQSALLDLLKDTEITRISAISLAEKAGISRATFYRHYDNVESVIEELEDQFVEEMRDASRYYLAMKFDVNDIQKSVPEVLGLVKVVKKYRDFILAVSSVNGDPRFARRAQNFFLEYYAGKLAYEGIIKENFDIYKEYAMAGQFAVLRYYLEKRQDISDEEISFLMLKLLYAPFQN